ncbi:hypothetical protein AGOR_G00212960 [Albula goreensis]|uniref:GB1/RHD3-type G domain-containing protein n=1 Tax=Albula goreensis TaxID=1534307 RepID=A0A8T3CRH8_9TELE|nr:hypothetical protein AGOR_G00212960 [Albula goreensis]
MSRLTVSMPEPVCLIDNDAHGNLRVVPEALDILRRIDQLVVVVGVVGLYRTGKSYLMNKLAGANKGFALGATIQSKTKGIWMWALPHPTKADHTLVLLDTEGLGDVEKGDEKNDNWIFSLAVLLSCTLVYNSKGTIDNDALQRLHYVSELTEHIKVKSTTGSEDEDESSEFMRFFPSFVWAVRDFTLTLELDGKPVSSDEYLENALKLKPGHGKQAMAYNMPRNCLRNYFPTRKCFVFDCPASAEKMKVLDDLTDGDLEPSFVRQTNAFCDYVFKNTEVKTMKGGYRVTGKMLGNLAKMYVDAISSGQIPCLDNAVQALAQIENTNAVAKALASYREFMAGFVSLPTETQDELSDIHGQAEKGAVKIFMESCFKDEDQKFQLELMKQLEAEYTAICEKNVAESKKACQAIIRRIFKPLEEHIESGCYAEAGGYLKYSGDLKTFVSQYKAAEGKGIKGEETLNEYLATKESIGQAILAADKSLSEAQRREEVNKARMEALEQERKASEEQRKIMEQRILDQERSYKENMEQMLRKMEEDRKHADAEYQRVLNAKLEEQAALFKEGFDKKARLMQDEIDSLNAQKAENQNTGSRGFLSTALDTVGTAAAMFLPGIIPKVAGMGLSLVSRFFK